MPNRRAWDRPTSRDAQDWSALFWASFEDLTGWRQDGERGAGQVFHFPAGFVMREENKCLRCKLVIEVQAQAMLDTGGSAPT